MFDVTIVGAGASGLMAAIAAARENAAVLLLEQKERIGKKLLATGNGKCNFTNEDMSLTHFHGDRTLAAEILLQFTKEQTLAFFHDIGIYPRQKNGGYYPNSEQASAVLTALEMEICRYPIRVHTDCPVLSVTKKGNCFHIHTKQGEFSSKTVIYATGLLASPKLGSDGSAFTQIKDFGHRFCPIVPALCGFYATGMDFKKVAGVRTQGRITLEIDKTETASDSGELQFTEYGISGIPVFQVSRHASRALYEKKTVTARIHFLHRMSDAQIREEIAFRARRFPDKIPPEQLLNGLLPQKIILALKSRLPAPSGGWDDGWLSLHFDELLRMICAFPVALVRPREFAYAQVCAGGIPETEVDVHTLESRYVRGLFFAGELLNVDGICGGYNLQWAWSSGAVAGKNAAQFAQNQRK